MTFIDLFCGAGGMSLGLQDAGFSAELGIDIDPMSIRTYTKNVSEAKLMSVSELTTADIPVGIDVIVGGPPCQGFSKQRKGAADGNDPRNALLKDFCRVIVEVRPAAFILENVAVFGQKRGKDLLSEMKGELDFYGYEFFPHFYNCADYGLAQTRERFVLVGTEGFEFTPPEPTVDEWQTVKMHIGDLPSPPEDYSDDPELPNHQAARVTSKNIERISHVPPGGDWRDIPHDLRLACHQRIDENTPGGWTDVYGRLQWDGQAPTLTGGFDSFTRGRYAHPEEDRPLTPREGARLQGFPDWFKFFGTRADWRRQIGNAVPPPLATAIGKSLKEAMS